MSEQRYKVADEVEIRMCEEFNEAIKDEKEEHDNHSLYWARYYDDALGITRDRRGDDTRTVIITEEEKQKQREDREKKRLVKNKRFRDEVPTEQVQLRIREWLEKNKEEILLLKKGIPDDLERIFQIEKKPKLRELKD